MTDTIEQDPVERVAFYRPTSAQIDVEFGPARRSALRAEIMAGATGIGFRQRAARSRRRVNATVASAVTVAALIVGVLLIVVPSEHATAPGVPGAGAPYVPGDFTETPVVGDAQFAYRATTMYDIDDSGTASVVGRNEIWAAPDGSQYQRTTDFRQASDNYCAHRGVPDQVNFDNATSAFFAQLPTGPAALESYLRAHVSGSTSQDEAVFVAAGDMLRASDLLATSRFRSALVTVLSGISRITVHSGVTDYLGRPAVRVDFVDQANRPGELDSLYFDASTFQLLEERTGHSGGPENYDGPSPAYLGHDSASPTQDQLSGAASVSVTTAERVVDAVPADVRQCAPSS